MSRTLFGLVLLPSLGLLAAPAAWAQRGAIYASAVCTGTQIAVHWDYWSNPVDSVAQPEWVGWEVERRRAGTCEAWVRASSASLPRLPGTHARDFSEPAPAENFTYQYRVVPVDATRAFVALPGVDASGSVAFASCPAHSGPVIQGRLLDLGWALAVVPCADQCWAAQAYFTDPDRRSELQGFAGTATVLKFFGELSCGTVEGCALGIERWEVASCASVDVRRATWGRLKTAYR